MLRNGRPLASPAEVALGGEGARDEAAGRLREVSGLVEDGMANAPTSRVFRGMDLAQVAAVSASISEASARTRIKVRAQVSKAATSLAAACA